VSEEEEIRETRDTVLRLVGLGYNFYWLAARFGIHPSDMKGFAHPNYGNVTLTPMVRLQIRQAAVEMELLGKIK
jgi:hypothetical protein